MDSWEADDLWEADLMDSWEADLMDLWETGLVGLDFVTTIVSLITTVSLTTIGSSFIIRTVSFSVLISFRLASLGGTPTPTITTTRTIIPIMTMDRLTITSIGTIWLCQSNRNLPGAAITTALLTG